MGRLSRVVLPGVVHHVTQRGVRSMKLFPAKNGKNTYLTFLNKQIDRAGLGFIGYCLMDNHFHLLVVPSNEDSLKKGIGEVHRQYTYHLNFRLKTRGHLFQGRFYSCPLDDSHLLAAERYVKRNPVRAGIYKHVFPS